MLVAGDAHPTAPPAVVAPPGIVEGPSALLLDGRNSAGRRESLGC
jgi:hypothetical protein